MKKKPLIIARGQSNDIGIAERFKQFTYDGESEPENKETADQYVANLNDLIKLFKSIDECFNFNTNKQSHEKTTH